MVCGVDVMWRSVAYRWSVIVIVAGSFLGSPAFGADAFVVARSPGVLVNPGAGYMPVETMQQVKAGDQVMVNETGQGWIVYCGCDEEIQPNKVYTVEERECKVETVRLDEPNLPHTVLHGDQREDQEISRCRGAAWFGGGGGGWYLLAIPAVVAGVGLAIAGSDGKGAGLVAKPTPTSP